MQDLRQRQVQGAILIALALLGVTLRARALGSRTAQDLCGADFPVFYAGGRLAGTAALYSPEAVQADEQRQMGCSSGSASFIRLPYFAAMMIPWAHLPFRTAFWLWRAASVVAIGVFIWLWPAPKRWSLLACAWSVALGFAVTSGQDVAFLLMWLALGQQFRRRGQCFRAGLSLAMCAAKFHCFLLLPLLLLRYRRMAAGFATGGAILAAASFAVQGVAWPIRYLAAIANPAIDVGGRGFTNLEGIAHGRLGVEVALGMAVAAAAAYVIRRADFDYSLATTLAGSVLLSHHQTISDVALLIPVALTLAWHPRARHTRVIAIYLATPVAYFMMMSTAVDLPRLLLLGTVFLLAYEIRPEALRAGRENSSIAAAAISDARQIG